MYFVGFFFHNFSLAQVVPVYYQEIICIKIKCLHVIKQVLQHGKVVGGARRQKRPEPKTIPL